MKFISSDIANAFPAQKVPDSKKSQEFFKKCADVGASMVNFDRDTGVRASRKNKVVNYNLWNDIVDTEEIQRIVNPFGIEYGKLPDNYRNMPLLNPNIMVLIGEERRRYFNPIVTVINSDAISEKMRVQSERLREFSISEVTNPTMSKEELESRIREIDKWQKYTYRDRRERMVSQMMEYGYRTLNLKEVFSSGFEDLVIAGEEIYVADIVAGEPILRKAHPVDIITIRSGHSNRIEDSDIIIEDIYMPIGKIIDSYHEFLKDSDIKKLEEGINTWKSAKGFMKNQLTHGHDYEDYIAQEGIGNIIHKANKNDTFAFGGTFDEDGNVRVTRTLWKGMRRVGIIEYFDEDGDLQKIVVPDTIEPDESLGQTVEYKWISEWYEATRIADDIYVKMQPREIQFRKMENISDCKPGVVGIVNNVGKEQGRSIMDIGKNYQYLYNAIMHRMEQAAAKDKGKIGRLDLSMIPEGWSIDKWLYYAEMTGWAIHDPFNEGNKGAALGKLSGGMQQQQNTFDLEQGRFIQQQFMILEFLSNRIDNITGITPQRKGAVDNRETLGGVQMAVNKSSHITEKWFGIHDNVKLKALEAWIETCKVAWKDQKFKRSYILDDGSQAVLDFDYDKFIEAEYGIYISTASSDQEMMQHLQSLTQPFMQNGGTFSMIMDLFRTKDPASLQRKFETYEEEIQKRQEAQAKEQMKAEQSIRQAEMQLEQAKLDLERYKADLERLTKLDVEAMKQDSDIDDEKLELERRKLEEDIEAQKRELDLKRDQLEETRRHNKAQEKKSTSK